MGCFSFMCKQCGKPILSNSFSGQMVKLYLLKKGVIIQEMEGQYDSYGRVFNEDCSDSIKWRNPYPEDPIEEDEQGWNSWDRVCNLMFDEDKSNGIAAIHSECYKGLVPITRSEGDPNQGWGEPDEDDEYSGCFYDEDDEDEEMEA